MPSTKAACGRWTCHHEHATKARRAQRFGDSGERLQQLDEVGAAVLRRAGVPRRMDARGAAERIDLQAGVVTESGPTAPARDGGDDETRTRDLCRDRAAF